MPYQALKSLLESEHHASDTEAADAFRQASGDLIDWGDSDVKVNYASVSAGYGGGTADLDLQGDTVKASYVMTEDECETYAGDFGGDTDPVKQFKDEIVAEFKSAAKEAGFEMTSTEVTNGLHLSAIWRSKNEVVATQSRTPISIGRDYDPQQAYFDRMTPARRSMEARRRSHQFPHQGGHDANYKF